MFKSSSEPISILQHYDKAFPFLLDLLPLAKLIPNRRALRAAKTSITALCNNPAVLTLAAQKVRGGWEELRTSSPGDPGSNTVG